MAPGEDLPSQKVRRYRLDTDSDTEKESTSQRLIQKGGGRGQTYRNPNPVLCAPQNASIQRQEKGTFPCDRESQAG